MIELEMTAELKVRDAPEMAIEFKCIGHWIPAYAGMTIDLE